MKGEIIMLTANEKKELRQYAFSFRFCNKRVSKKAMVERYGKDELERRMLDCCRYWFDERDNYGNQYMDGLWIMVSDKY